jgi:4-amino-4-deoxy-L-arabinose transferase-like glycosyltransferase
MGMKQYLGVLLVALIGVVFIVSGDSALYGDEYVFLKLTQQLPNDTTTGDWIINERPEIMNDVYTEELCHAAYDAEVWIHPTLPNYLMYPFTKMINLTDARIARMIPLALALISMALITNIIRRKWGENIAMVSSLPFVFALILILSGHWFYYDAFMMVFFAVSLWIIYTRGMSKWLYLTIPAMLLSKEIGVLLLIPLAIAVLWKTRSVKQVLMLGFTVIPLAAWYVYAAIETGDILFYLHHWQDLTYLSTGNNLGNFISSLPHFLLKWGLGFYALATIPAVIMIIKHKAYEHLPFVSFWFIMGVYAIGWGMVPYHLFNMLFAGMYLTAYTAQYLKLKYT